MFLETKPGAQSPGKLKNFSKSIPWQIMNSGGTTIGHLSFTNDIKLEVVPTQKAEDGSTIAITGDLKEKRFIFLKKWHSSGEQLRFGECEGRHIVKKGFFDTQFAVNVELQDLKASRLVICGVVLICLLC